MPEEVKTQRLPPLKPGGAKAEQKLPPKPGEKKEEKRSKWPLILALGVGAGVLLYALRARAAECSPEQCQPPYPDLKLGDKGNCVGLLQYKLRMAGYYQGNVTCEFDQTTEEAVKAFQQANGLTPDGIVNINVWNLLDYIKPPEGGEEGEKPPPTTPTCRPEECPSDVSQRPTIRRGDEGPCVGLAQQLLIKNGFDPGPEGVDCKFGRNTEAAVKAFQRAKGLTDDGIVGPKTWAALEGIVQPPQPPQCPPDFVWDPAQQRCVPVGPPKPPEAQMPKLRLGLITFE